MRIGILGGGQLARMLSYTAFRLGMQVAIFDQKSSAPSFQITPHHFIGKWSNEKLLKKFSDSVDVITLENEFIDHQVIEYLETLSTPVFPSSKTISKIQDKLIQKKTLKEASLAVTNFQEITSLDDAMMFGKTCDFRFVLKARKQGYDGYGNRTIHSSKDILSTMKELGFPKASLYAETFVKFKKEIATIIIRNQEKKIVMYPIVETIQENHICKIVKAPIELSPSVEKKIKSFAKKIAETIDLTGIVAVEMFLLNNEEVLINELAPRPHNSGHYTIESCYTSQFENHLRSITGLPLGDPSMKVPTAVMLNILGKGKIDFSSLTHINTNSSATIHLYGKETSTIGRKMGHITAVGENPNQCLNIARSIEKKIVF